MGLIKAALSATKATLRNQYKDMIICDDMGNEILVTRGKKQNDEYSSNKGQENIITDGSVIVVGSGQCALMVSQGKVVDFCAEAGEYIWDTGAAPSVLNSGLDGLKGSISTIISRFQAGGNSLNDMRVYYVNTKHIIGNKFGKGQIPFRDAEFQFTIKLGCYGSYEYQIVNPVLFFENAVGFNDKDYTRKAIDDSLYPGVVQAMLPAFAAVSRAQITYDQIGADVKVLTKAMQDELRDEWENLKGVTVVTLKVDITPDAESLEKIEQFQMSRAMGSNQAIMQGRMVAATANAMENASSNENGAMMGFMGMGMANAAGGNAMGQMQNMQTPQAPQQAVAGWVCACGNHVNGNFCANCGGKKPQPIQKETWACPCGELTNTGKFCASCGSGKVEPSPSWGCACGNQGITGKFCADCGSQKPSNPDLKCDNPSCGYVAATTFKFCPECGTENKE